MNRYEGNTGRFIRMPDPEPPRRREQPRYPLIAQRQAASGPPGRETAESRPPRPHQPPRYPAREERRPGKGPPPNRGGGLGGLLSGVPSAFSSLLSHISPGSLETEDLLLMLVLYLMYRESGDRELLIILGAMLFL